MKIKSIKSWLEEGKKQFIIKDVFESGNPRVVQRIKDDAIFCVGRQKCIKYLKFAEFNLDCIHVKVLCTSKSGNRQILNCHVNSIILNKEGSEIIGWEGVEE